MDPTNANAVAGPSRIADALPSAPPPGVAADPVVPIAVAAATATGSTTQANWTTTTTYTTTVTSEPRPPKGPTIIPTEIDADGIKTVPNLFELCQVDDLITLISSMLDRLIQHNDRIPLTPSSLTRFHSRAPPSINVRDYLLRIARYTNVEPCCLLILLPYVDKVCARLTTFTISSLTVHRFIIAGVSVGSKALSDSFCTNGRYARVGGVSIAEMNLLEKELCEAIDWRLTTTGTVLAHYYTSLVTSHPLYRLAHPLPPPPSASSTPTPSTNATSAHSTLSARKGHPPGDILMNGDASIDPAEGRQDPVDSTDAPPTPMDQDLASSSTTSLEPPHGSSSSVPPSSAMIDDVAPVAPSRVLPPGLARHLLSERVVGGSTRMIPVGAAVPSPALIPAPTGKRRQATASNLPSPVRGVGLDETDRPDVLVGFEGVTTREEGQGTSMEQDEQPEEEEELEERVDYPDGSPLGSNEDDEEEVEEDDDVAPSNGRGIAQRGGAEGAAGGKRMASHSPFPTTPEQRSRKALHADSSMSNEVGMVDEARGSGGR